MELTLDALLDDSALVADYLKAFLNKTAWKQAKRVLLLIDFKIGDDKRTIALPFKRETDAVATLRRIKKDKIHPFNKLGFGEVEFSNEDEDGKWRAKVRLTAGSAAGELLERKGQKLFAKLKCALEITVDEKAQAQPDSETSLESEPSIQEQVAIEPKQETTPPPVQNTPPPPKPMTKEEVVRNLKAVQNNLQKIAHRLGLDLNVFKS